MASTEAVTGQKRERPEEAMAPVPEEMSLPSAAITRIVKSKLPDGVMVGKDTRLALGKSCSIFILYITTMCVAATRMRMGLQQQPIAPKRQAVARCLRPTQQHRSPARAPLAAGSANDLAKEAKRTTVTAQDVINALKELEFDEFVPSIEGCLAGLRHLPFAQASDVGCPLA